MSVILSETSLGVVIHEDAVAKPRDRLSPGQADFLSGSSDKAGESSSLVEPVRNAAETMSRRTIED
jgi:hypothetical protein